MCRILVIGATGTIGGQVVSQLTAAGVGVRAMVRAPDRALLPPGVEAMRGDLTRPDTLEACLKGVDGVFLVWTAPGTTAAAVVERIAKYARRIVFLSAPLKTPHPFFQQPNPSRTLAEQIEALIETSGLEWTMLRPHMFASNSVGFWGPAIRAGGVVRWPCLAAPTAPIHDGDIAAVGVRALLEDGHAGAEYVLTGPESLTQREQIETIGRAIGRTLSIEEMTEEEWRATLPAPVANLLFNAWSAAPGRPAWVTSTFAEVTGGPPRTFFEWAVEHAALFREE